MRKAGTILATAVLIFGAAFFPAACWSPESDGGRSRRTGSRDRTPPENERTSPTPDKKGEQNNRNADEKMNDETNGEEIKSGGFAANLPAGFDRPTDPVGQKMLREYGAMFVAGGGAVPPDRVVFENEAEVAAWQSGVSKSTANIGGTTVELQTPAMEALQKAVAEARRQGLSITPRGGADAARRNYSGTVKNWKSRVEPNLDHYLRQNKITRAEADRIRSLPIPAQISEIFRLEDRGLWFSTNRDKSIIYSVAPPGTSQHISMLALDVREFDNPEVRQILARHGWFQTVKSDLPHFTYLGRAESDLTALGLKKVDDSGRVFWVPDI